MMDVASFGAILGLFIWLLMVAITLWHLYWVVRKGVTAGIKDYAQKHGDRAGSLRPWTKAMRTARTL
jgi:mannose/fructose/N-acetylgalactosamine-specific phosphotransferase system component IID